MSILNIRETKAKEQLAKNIAIIEELTAEEKLLASVRQNIEVKQADVAALQIRLGDLVWKSPTGSRPPTQTRRSRNLKPRNKRCKSRRPRFNQQSPASKMHVAPRALTLWPRTSRR